MSSIEIQPASLGQVVMGRGGRKIYIEDDVGNVARDLRDIDSSLRLMYNERSECFVVYQVTLDSEGHVRSEHLVTTAQECDQRLVNRVKKITQPGYDYLKELEKAEAKSKADSEYQLAERLGDAGERLYHAVRKDTMGADTGKYFFKAKEKDE